MRVLGYAALLTVPYKRLGPKAVVIWHLTPCVTDMDHVRESLLVSMGDRAISLSIHRVTFDAYALCLIMP